MKNYFNLTKFAQATMTRRRCRKSYQDSFSIGDRVKRNLFNGEVQIGTIIDIESHLPVTCDKEFFIRLDDGNTVTCLARDLEQLEFWEDPNLELNGYNDVKEDYGYNNDVEEDYDSDFDFDFDFD